MTSDRFIIKQKEPPKDSFFIRLNPKTIQRIDALVKKTGVKRPEIIQQALDYALDRLEAK